MKLPTEINVFIGYDEREAVAYHVACQSIIDNTSHPSVSVFPLRTKQLRDAGIYWRSKDLTASNDFSYTRFLVPYLSGGIGTSIYMDPDVIVKGDVLELLNYREVLCPVSVVKHDYTPKRSTKYFGAQQHAYPRKNWSSVMVFSNSSCQYQLTPENVSTKSPQWLHRFEWVGKRDIGEIPKAWNWLVEEYPHNDEAKLLHYTNGVPAIDGYGRTDHAEDWWHYHDRLQRARADG
jgi:lipopolysaccharide biosynthesis glycosyltransferase